MGQIEADPNVIMTGYGGNGVGAEEVKPDAAAVASNGWARIKTNQSPVDFFTIMHIEFGHLLQSLNVSFTNTILVSLAWEWILEPMYKKMQPELFPDPSQDSAVNKLMDTAAVGVGWYLAKRAEQGRRR